MFKIIGGKGFHITFANGYTVSVQFGVGNYTEIYNLPEGLDFDKQRDNMSKGIYPQASLAETAIIAPDGNFVEYDGGNVQGYRTPKQVLELLNFVENIGV